VPGIHGKREKRSLMKAMSVRNSWKKGKEVNYRSYEYPEFMKRRKSGHSERDERPEFAERGKRGHSWR
jgi:hypothetical protein